MEQRRNQIVELVNRKGSISFAQLKEAFPSVSEMTLRTDLKALDEARRVVRVHGGVKSVEQVVGTDDLLSRRSARNAEAKQIIAEKATALLRPNTTLFLDSGSTATAVARCIPDQTVLRRCDCEQKAVLLDSSKIGLKSTFHICELSDIDIVISDGKLPVEFLQACRNAGVTVL